MLGIGKTEAGSYRFDWRDLFVGNHECYRSVTGVHGSQLAHEKRTKTRCA